MLRKTNNWMLIHRSCTWRYTKDQSRTIFQCSMLWSTGLREFHANSVSVSMVPDLVWLVQYSKVKRITFWPYFLLSYPLYIPICIVMVPETLRKKFQRKCKISDNNRREEKRDLVSIANYLLLTDYLFGLLSSLWCAIFFPDLSTLCIHDCHLEIRRINWTPLFVKNQ